MFNRRYTGTNRRPSPNAGGSAFTPAALPSVSLWLDPTRGISGSSPISTWTDQIGGYVFTNAFSASVVPGTGINGHATADNPSESNSGFTCPTAISSVVTASLWFFAAAFRYTGTQTTANVGSTSYLIPALLGDANGGIVLGATTTAWLTAQFGASYGNDTGQAISTATNYYVFAKYDGTNVYTAINGGAYDAGVAVANASNLTGGMRTLGNFNAGIGFKGSAGDIIACKQIPSAAQQTQLATWFHTRYGI